MAAATLLLSGACWLFYCFDSTIYREHGPLEIFQVVCLAFCMVVFGIPAVRARSLPLNLLAASLALFCFTFLLLEVDLRSVVTPWLETVLNGPLRDVWLGLLWLGAAVLGFVTLRPLTCHFRKWILSASRVGTFYAGAFWLVSGFVDKVKPFRSEENPLLVEEIMEVNGAFFMGFAALLFLKWWRQTGVSSEAAG